MKKKTPKKKIKKNIFDFEYLDDEEKELIESIEKGPWTPLPQEEQMRMMALMRQAARNTMRKDARVNIRLTNNDLRGLKAKAAVEGIPYQTLLTALVHKYVTGQIKLFS
jgi:predicted DNA binding CopG/RHH family protein